MNRDEAALIRYTQEFERNERNRLSRQLGGLEPDDETTGAQPLSRRQLKDLLRRDRTPKETK